MREGAMFAGIGAPACAMGRAPVWYSEIEPFPNAVMAHHFPDATAIGDCTQVDPSTLEPVDIITAGFPCQDLSVAGKRAGLEGERSGLFWEIIRYADALDVPYLLLENVPGLLSSHGGRDHATVLGALVGADGPVDTPEGGWRSAGVVCGPTGVATYRVLDAQYFGVPQRRRRWFCVVERHPRTVRGPQILFEPDGVRGDSPPRRETGEDVAGTLGGRIARSHTELDGHGAYPLIEVTNKDGAYRGGGVGIGCAGDPMFTLQAGREHGVALAFKPSHYTRDKDGAPSPVTPPLLANAKSGDEQPVIMATQQTPKGFSSTTAPTLQVPSPSGGGQQHVVVASTLVTGGRETPPHGTLDGKNLVLAPTLRGGGREQGAGSSDDNTPWVVSMGSDPYTEQGTAHPVTGRNGDPGVLGTPVPRRLTPTECERLQGLPDGWTDIPGASDSKRYRALGNSMAVPCVGWILARIEAALAAP